MPENTMQYPRATPEEVWALLREIAEGQKETRLQMQETDRQMQETDRRMEETRLQMQETDRIVQETSKQIKATDKKVGELSNRFGELAEHLVAPNIKEKFNALGFTFNKVSQNIQITNAAGTHAAEIDILLENGDTVIAVEVKAKPKQSDIDDHIKRMELLRAEDGQRSRIFHGAIAGAIMSNELRNYILKNGFFPIEQSGETVKISAPEGFKPRRW